jgi:hypothetical protein
VGTQSAGPVASPVDAVGFELLGEELADDVRVALAVALQEGAVFFGGATPLAIFRHFLETAIRDINGGPRGRLLQRFLGDGPYEGDETEVPTSLRDKRLSDDETTQAIAFIYSHMVNCLQGGLMELLAARPCLHVFHQLQDAGVLPRTARLYVGDSVLVRRRGSGGFAKGADLHILLGDDAPGPAPALTVCGVAEVKSYHCHWTRLSRQLALHLVRARLGLNVEDVAYRSDQITVGFGRGRKAVRIGVLPARWRLPRTFQFETVEDRRVLRVTSAIAPQEGDSVVQIGENEWRVTLRWSREALASAAYELAFWYMAKVGEVLYSCGVPGEWSEMTPAEAGWNAAKMMLYYAIRRCRTAREQQRAVALYNSYAFGYALGMNFRNRAGRREMLWPQDLDQIAEDGQTESGCRIV